MHDKSESGTQTTAEFSEDTLFLAQPNIDILYSIYQEVLTSRIKNISLFNKMISIFHIIKDEENNSADLRVCLKICQIFVDSIESKTENRRVIDYTCLISSKLLASLKGTDINERLALEEYVRVHDSQNKSTRTSTLKPMAWIVGSTSEHYGNLKSDAYTQTFHTQDSTIRVVEPKEFVSVSHADLARHFKTLSQDIPPLSSRTPKEHAYFGRKFSILQQEMWNFFNQNIMKFPSSNFYPLHHHVMQGFSMSLNIQVAYIHYLDSADVAMPRIGKNLKKISKAFQLMSQLLRVYNRYFQNSDATKQQKENMILYVKYIQNKSLDAKEILAYRTILDCHCLTNTEKGKLEENYLNLQQIQISNVTELFKSFYDVQEKPPKTQETPFPEEMDESEIREALQSTKLHHTRIRILLERATNRLLSVLMEVIPEGLDRQIAFSYVDGKILYKDDEFINRDYVENFCKNPVLTLKLLLITELYYKIKIQYLKAYIPTIPNTEQELIKFLQDDIFTSHFRKDSYRWILLDNPEITPDNIIENCQEILSHPELSTPLIEFIATYKLQQAQALNVKEKRTARSETAESTESTESTSLSANIKESIFEQADSVNISTIGIAKKKNTVLANVFDELINEFNSLDLLTFAPGWGDCKERSKILISNHDYDAAWNEVENWLYYALQDEDAETLPYKRSIFEAIYFRSELENLKGNHTNSLIILEKLKGYRVHEKYRRIYSQQTQQILCQQGFIYKQIGNTEKAQTCFAEATAHASNVSMLCFPSLYEDLSCFMHVDNFRDYLDYIDYLQNLPPLLLDNDYHLNYMYKFYTLLMGKGMNRSDEQLKEDLLLNKILRLPRDKVALSSSLQATNSKKRYTEEVVNIAKLMINFSRLDPSMRANIYIRLIDSSFILFQEEKSRWHLSQTLRYIELLEKEGYVLEGTMQKNINGYKFYLKNLQKPNRRGVYNQALVKLALYSPEKIKDDYLIPPNNEKISMEEYEELTYKVIRTHSVLFQIQYIVYFIYKESMTDQKLMLSLMIKNLERLMKNYHDITSDRYESVCSRDESYLDCWHKFEQTYIMKLMHMKYYYETRLDIQSPVTSYEYQEELRKTLNLIKKFKEKYGFSKKIDKEEISRDILPMQDRFQQESNLSLINLMKLKAATKDRTFFTNGLLNLHDNRYCIAFVSIMINLSQSDNNIERLKISHYLIGKILVWVLEAMTSPFMQEKFLDDLLKQEEMLVLFSDLSCICNKHLDISKESSIINPDDITKTRELLEEIKNKHMNMQFSIEVAGPGKLRNISIFSAVEDEEPLSGNTKVCSR